MDRAQDILLSLHWETRGWGSHLPCQALCASPTVEPSFPINLSFSCSIPLLSFSSSIASLPRYPPLQNDCPSFLSQASVTSLWKPGLLPWTPEWEKHILPRPRRLFASHSNCVPSSWSFWKLLVQDGLPCLPCHVSLLFWWPWHFH